MIDLQDWERLSDSLFVTDRSTRMSYEIDKRGDGYGWSMGRHMFVNQTPSATSQRVFASEQEAFDDLCSYIEWNDAHCGALVAKRFADAHGLTLEELAAGSGR